MDEALLRLAVDVELHEALVWTKCFDALAALPGNPLGVVVDRSGPCPLMLLTAVDSASINRVVGLGMSSPATRDVIDRVVAFHRSHGRSTFQVEASPAASPPEFPTLLEEAGLRRNERTHTKLWRTTDDVPEPVKDVEVRTLGPQHREAVADLNVVAWGAWDDADVLKLWFGTTVGAPDFHHFGIFDGDRLVSVGALCVADGIGWAGFAASHPRYRGNDFRHIINRVRLTRAREYGCRLVHTEVETRYASSPKLPFTRLYDRPAYSPIP